MQIQISGRSDDGIDLAGDLRDELRITSEQATYVHFSAASALVAVVLVRWCQEPGKTWSLSVESMDPDHAVIDRREPVLEDGEHFTDVLNLSCPDGTKATAWRSEEGPTNRDAVEFFEEKFDPRSFSASALVAAMRALGEAGPGA